MAGSSRCSSRSPACTRSHEPGEQHRRRRPLHGAPAMKVTADRRARTSQATTPSSEPWCDTKRPARSTTAVVGENTELSLRGGKPSQLARLEEEPRVRRARQRPPCRVHRRPRSCFSNHPLDRLLLALSVALEARYRAPCRCSPPVERRTPACRRAVLRRGRHRRPGSEIRPGCPMVSALQHMHHHQVARAESTIEPVGIA